ncbi:hypothetical protein EJ03DRAFT_338636 [Teratosphaeria nubilosa]|uniref:DUF300-domain-containing protein n=1 Tax=Teratosphaeria nubilosa TaxID=161662 RepID=A0A6G1KZL2_9PEZI|nr:hypothetical protein EJ03DRAFT_338636 [Teratosphaeria nubilosa]
MSYTIHSVILRIREAAASETSGIPQGNDTCAAPLTNDVGDPIAGNLTVHHIMILVCAPCLGLTIASTLYLEWRHLHCYKVPQEQRQILRIASLPAVYATFDFLALLFILDYQYIAPIAKIYEAFSIAALFFLVLEWACPDGTDREKYFSNLQGKDKKGNNVPGGSLKWFQTTSRNALQFPLTKLVLIVIQIVTQYYHVFCENSMSPKHAHLWIFLFDIFFVGGAFEGVTSFAKRMGKEGAISASHRARGRILTLLGIVIFQVLQDFIFGLMNGKLFKPSKTVTYNDLNFGIPATLTILESVFFSLLMQWSFSAKEYKEGVRMDRYGMAPAVRTKTWRALLDAFNLIDIILGTITAFGLLFGSVQSRYSARSGGHHQRTKGSHSGMEPLSERTRM